MPLKQILRIEIKMYKLNYFFLYTSIVKNKFKLLQTHHQVYKTKFYRIQRGFFLLLRSRSQ